MKNTPLLLIALFGMAAPLFAQTAEKTLSKSFNTEGKDKLVLDLPGSVEIRVWDQAEIRVEIKVSLPNGNPSMLNELANVGRYNLSASVESNFLHVQALNLQKQISIKGEALLEELSFVVYMPKNMMVEIANAPLAQAH